MSSGITKSRVAELAREGGLKVEGKESLSELVEAVAYLVQAWRERR